VIPSEPSEPIWTDYLSDENRWEVEFPNQVVMMGADTDGATMGLSMRADDPTGRPAGRPPGSAQPPVPVRQRNQVQALPRTRLPTGSFLTTLGSISMPFPRDARASDDW
jgi:hypothetical protein